MDVVYKNNYLEFHKNLNELINWFQDEFKSILSEEEIKEIATNNELLEKNTKNEYVLNFDLIVLKERFVEQVFFYWIKQEIEKHFTKSNKKEMLFNIFNKNYEEFNEEIAHSQEEIKRFLIKYKIDLHCFKDKFREVFKAYQKEIVYEWVETIVYKPLMKKIMLASCLFLFSVSILFYSGEISDGAIFTVVMLNLISFFYLLSFDANLCSKKVHSILNDLNFNKFTNNEIKILNKFQSIITKEGDFNLSVQDLINHLKWLNKRSVNKTFVWGIKYCEISSIFNIKEIKRLNEDFEKFNKKLILYQLKNNQN